MTSCLTKPKKSVENGIVLSVSVIIMMKKKDILYTAVVAKGFLRQKTAEGPSDHAKKCMKGPRV
jgi:hypothetical protein